jgi:hypothetical protein
LPSLLAPQTYLASDQWRDANQSAVLGWLVLTTEALSLPSDFQRLRLPQWHKEASLLRTRKYAEGVAHEDREVWSSPRSNEGLSARHSGSDGYYADLEFGYAAVALSAAVTSGHGLPWTPPTSGQRQRSVPETALRLISPILPFPLNPMVQTSKEQVEGAEAAREEPGN